MSILVLIPARMAATRLPGKPLADIGGRPMVVHVADRARESGVGRVAIATDSPAIRDAAAAFGHEAVMTSPDHQSGSDRISEALEKLDPEGRAGAVLNLQGDLPTIDPALIGRAAALLDDAGVDIGTLGAEIVREEERADPNVVKIVGSPLGPARLRALYFTRAMGAGAASPPYRHLRLAARRASALRVAAALGAGDAREAGAAARAGGGHAHRCCDRRHRAARRRHAG
jgi:3-deoxy-manno-octulosonate cytidylyltransferase (CMP-KDO synthetase)